MINRTFKLLVIVAVLFIAGLFSYTYLNRNNFNKNSYIEVKGSGAIDFESDHVVWEGYYSAKNNNLSEAFDLLSQHNKIVRSFLTKKNIKEDEIVFGPIETTRQTKNIYNNNGNYVGEEFQYYSLRQNITIESSEIQKIENVSREITEVLDQGVEFYSYPPRYYYTKLEDLKLDLIDKATIDAKRRAELIAKQTDVNLKIVKSAEMGILQIIGKNSGEDFTWSGAYNTSSKQKTASMNMNLVYEIE
ncbi:MAG: SIMPL domain-containing protein [Flavobacteriaceae bacterium]